MAALGGMSLARVTVAAPTRRLDLALPDNLLVGELLPYLLRHAGEGLADQGERHGGWLLRRATGTVLEPTRNLAVQGVRDGELLQLTPRRLDWPEPAYDDVVEVIASGARRSGRSWGQANTRRCGLATAAGVLALGLVAVALAGPPWTLPATVAIGLAATLTVVGILTARAFGDGGAGAAAAVAGLPYAALGGALLPGPDDAALAGLGAPNLLLGAALLAAFSIAGHAGTAAAARLFTAGAGVGLAGLLAGAISLAGATPAGAAAITLTVGIGLLPGYPLIAGWLGRLPFPELPARPEEILEDRPPPPRTDVFAAVARSGELLAGMLLAAAVAGAAAMALLLVVDRSPAATLLVIAGALALLLRGRLFATAGQRLPLLISGAVGLALPVLAAVLAAAPGGPRLAYLSVLVAAAAILFAAGLHFGRRTPSPYLGRLADIADVVAIMALIPLACAVLGVYGTIRGLFASIGG